MRVVRARRSRLQKAAPPRYTVCRNGKQYTRYPRGTFRPTRTQVALNACRPTKAATRRLRKAGRRCGRQQVAQKARRPMKAATRRLRKAGRRCGRQQVIQKARRPTKAATRRLRKAGRRCGRQQVAQKTETKHARTGRQTYVLRTQGRRAQNDGSAPAKS